MFRRFRTTALATMLLLAYALPARGIAQAPRTTNDGATRPDPAEVLEASFDRPLLEDVQSRFESEQPRTLAWAGYLAGEHGLHEVVPLIHDALERLLAHRNTVEVRCARLVLLDALCRFGADLPDELLEALDLDAASRPALLTLIARHPEGRQPIMLRWLRACHGRDTQGLYRACGTLLAQNPSPEFVTFLVSNLCLAVDLNVNDLAGRGSARGHGGGWGTGGHHLPRLPEAFPPIAVWKIPETPEPGDQLITRAYPGDGEPSFVRRHVCRKYLDEPHGSSFSEQDDQLLRWLERCSSPPGNSSRRPSGLQAYESLTIDLKTDDWDAAVDRLTGLWKRRFDKLVDGLGKRGLLPEGRPTMDDVFEIHLHDFRTDRIGPLPELVWPREAPVSAVWKTRERVAPPDDG